MTCDLLSTHAYVFEYGHSTDTAVCIALKCWKTVDMESKMHNRDDKDSYDADVFEYSRCILENNMTKAS